MSIEFKFWPVALRVRRRFKFFRLGRLDPSFAFELSRMEFKLVSESNERSGKEVRDVDWISMLVRLERVKSEEGIEPVGMSLFPISLKDLRPTRWPKVSSRAAGTAG